MFSLYAVYMKLRDTLFILVLFVTERQQITYNNNSNKFILYSVTSNIVLDAARIRRNYNTVEEDIRHV